MVKASSTIATQMPIASPRAASAAAQPTKVPMVTVVVFNTGHRAYSDRVNPSASATRTGSGRALIPGSGTKVRAPPTRASTSRNAYSVPSESVRSAGIATQVSQQRDGVRHQPLQHPRHQKKKSDEKDHQARDGAEGV